MTHRSPNQANGFQWGNASGGRNEGFGMNIYIHTTIIHLDSYGGGIPWGAMETFSLASMRMQV